MAQLMLEIHAMRRKRRSETSQATHTVKLAPLTFCALAVCILLTGCSHCVLFVLHPINYTFARHSNPISGWHGCNLVSLQKNPTINADYQEYIEKLPPKQRNYVGGVFFFEDGTGQHAVQIGVGLNGIQWQHVLIYDENNKRLKVIKYVSNYYGC